MIRRQIITPATVVTTHMVSFCHCTVTTPSVSAFHAALTFATLCRGRPSSPFSVTIVDTRYLKLSEYLDRLSTTDLFTRLEYEGTDLELYFLPSRMAVIARSQDAVA